MVRSPRIWIVAQIFAIALLGEALGWWSVQTYPDSASYIRASQMTFESALCQSRTLGYPMILRVFASISPTFQLLPYLQLAMLFPAVFLLDLGLRRFGASPWEAFAVSSGFMYGTIQQIWTVASVLTDFPSAVVSGMAIACLFLVVSRPRHIGGWMGLTLFVAAAYHIRPASLYLIPLTPCLGIVLRRILLRSQARPFAWKRMFLALSCVSILPLLAFCAIRWAVVGDFALVPLGGTSTVGMASELLNRKIAKADISKKYRPFANEILQGRMERGLRSAFTSGLWVDMRTYEDNYSVNIYKIAKPAASKFFGEDTIIQNREMAGFSREVILLRASRYLLWAVQYWPRAVMKVLYRYWVLQVSIPFALVLIVIRRLRRPLRDIPPQGQNRSIKLTPTILPALMWLNFLYFGAAISVLILACVYADSRYIVPAAVYLPSLIGLLILSEFRAIGPDSSGPSEQRMDGSHKLGVESHVNEARGFDG